MYIYNHYAKTLVVTKATNHAKLQVSMQSRYIAQFRFLIYAIILRDVYRAF